MGTNFTVIQFQRQHFGNEPGSFNDIEPAVPFVGPAKDFVFDCPKVDPNDTALLLFQSRDVSHARNVFQANGIQVFGGLPVSPSRDTWNGNVLLVERHHGLRATGNVLHVESRNTSGGADGNIDDFMIDNVVIQYKTMELSPQRIIDVRCFGANGEDEVDDFDAIRDARDAVNAAGGGVLFFPPGTFIVSDTIELGPNTTVLGSGASSVLLAKPNVPAFSMLLIRHSHNVRVRELVLDGNRALTGEPTGPGNENRGCGILCAPGNEGQTGLSIRDVIICNHHRSGIRIAGPDNSENVYALNPNEVEVVGCRIHDCDRRGVWLTRVTRARIAGNAISGCMQAGIQLVLSRAAVIDGNVVQDIRQRGETTSGHGIAAANSFDYAIVNNVVSGNARWAIVASGGVGTSPEEGHPMSKRYVVANNICRANTAGGITLDPSTRDGEEPTGEIHPSFATVAGNVCADNTGAGIHTIHAGYVAVHGNVCDGTLSSGKDSESAGIAIVSSRHTVVGDNVLIANKYGVAFWGDPGTVPPDTPDMGHHLLGGNVYDGNNEEIYIGEHHPPIRQLNERPPGDEWGGINLPVKETLGNPANGVDGALYLNTQDRRLQMYAGGAWRTLQTTNDPSW
jgi:hypothetical protein